MLQVRGACQWCLSLCIAIARCKANGDAFTTGTLCTYLWGPVDLRFYMVLRAGLYWGFMMLWWSALTSMPVGDATAIVYCGPIFTAIFARLILREKLNWMFFVCLLLDVIGLVVISQPSFIFVGSVHRSPVYYKGSCCALAGSVVAGLLPVIVRLSSDCHWTSVEHVTAFFSTFVFSPAGLGLWYVHGRLTESDDEQPSHQLQIGSHWPVLVIAALVEFAGLGLQTYGYQVEEAARASVMTFLEIPFNYVLQAILFHQQPNMLAILGMLLILTSGILNIARKSCKISLAPQQCNDTNDVREACIQG